MKHIESLSSSNSQGMHNERYFRRKEKELSSILRQLPPESREFVTDLTSIFLERNEYERVRSNPEVISQLHDQLVGAGISEKKIKKIMRYFNLPINNK